MNIDAYVPSSPRNFFGKWRESYVTQLGIQSLPEFSELSQVKILDVWSGNSNISMDLMSHYQNAVIMLLDQSYQGIQRDGSVTRKHIDLDKQEDVSSVLDGERFHIVFINQLLQYIENPFWVVKHLFDNHLEEWWMLYFNISMRIFEHGNSVDDAMLFEILERTWSNLGVLESISVWNDMKQYHLKKPKQDIKLLVPDYRGYTAIWTQWFRRQKYSFVNLLPKQ